MTVQENLIILNYDKRINRLRLNAIRIIYYEQ